MRPSEIDRKRTPRVKQPFALTNREIMADLMYPVPAEAPKRPQGER